MKQIVEGLIEIDALAGRCRAAEAWQSSLGFHRLGMSSMGEHLPSTLGLRRTVHHLHQFFGLTRRNRRELQAAAPAAYLTTERCLAMRSQQFDPLNSHHFLVYLFWLANELFRREQSESGSLLNLPTKLYLLNKALHSVELFYEVEMPSEFFC